MARGDLESPLAFWAPARQTISAPIHIIRRLLELTSAYREIADFSRIITTRNATRPPPSLRRLIISDPVISKMVLPTKCGPGLSCLPPHRYESYQFAAWRVLPVELGAAKPIGSPMNTPEPYSRRAIKTWNEYYAFFVGPDRL